jgi:hypothetical protein
MIAVLKSLAKLADSDIQDLVKDLNDCRAHFYVTEDGEDSVQLAPSFVDDFCRDCLGPITAEQRARAAGREHTEHSAEFHLTGLSNEDLEALLRGWYRWVRNLAGKPGQDAKFSLFCELAHRTLAAECRRRGLNGQLKEMQKAILGGKCDASWDEESDSGARAAAPTQPS